MPCCHHGAGKMAVPVEEEGVCNRSLTLADYAKGVMFTVYSWSTLSRTMMMVVSILLLLFLLCLAGPVGLRPEAPFVGEVFLSLQRVSRNL